MTGTEQLVGLQFRLRETAGPRDEAPRPPVVGEPLSEAAALAIWKRLPPPTVEAEDEQEYSFPEVSPPPPTAGEVVEGSFPPLEEREEPESGETAPLEIVRYAPEGEVAVAPHLSVTFSQPMVSVTSHGEQATRGIPVQLTPQPPGEWRWVGTRTLVFEPVGRFPMATDYSVEVPAGTRSASGGELQTKARWSFATPSPKVVGSHPRGKSQGREPVLFLAFDQRVEPRAALEATEARIGDRALDLRLAAPEEVEADAAARALARDTQKGCGVALRFEDTLPAEAHVRLTVGPGKLSAEGPRAKETPQKLWFRTYGALKVRRHLCGWRGECRPGDPWTIRFSNPLDPEAFNESLLRVEPPLPGMTAAVGGSELMVRGCSRARTRYRLTVDSGLRDRFGQCLGEDRTVTFEVGPARPQLISAGGSLVVLDPAGKPEFPVYSTEHDELKVRLYRVDPGDWQRYERFLEHYPWERGRRKPPDEPVLESTVRVRADGGELVETRIDLRPALEGELGHVVVVVEPTRRTRDRPEEVRAWVQVTRLGIDVFEDQSRLLVWSTSLENGAPLAGVDLSVLPRGPSLKSAADGLGTLEKPEERRSRSRETQRVVVARRGADSAFVPCRSSGWGHDRDELRWYVLDDRKLYRPGERVHLKGWVRRFSRSDGISLLGGSRRKIRYELRDWQGHEILSGSSDLNDLGGFDLVLPLPETVNLGPVTLLLEANARARDLEGSKHRHLFGIQEFRRPEFEVSTQATTGPHFAGDTVAVTARAAYYAGGGLRDAEVTWTIHSEQGQYSPPGWDRFTFGSWAPWWLESGPRGSRPNAGASKTLKGTTDAAGRHHLEVELVSLAPPRPAVVSAEASVMDVNRQAWSSTARLLVHPGELYVGVASARTFYSSNEPLRIETIVTDLEGKAVGGRTLTLRLARREWKFRGGKYVQVEVDPQEKTTVCAEKPESCLFGAREGGTYRLTASVLDDRGRENQSELTLWVAGGAGPPRRDVERDEATLVPERKEYQPGEEARVLLQAPFYPAEGVLTLRRSGVLHSERFTLEGPSRTLKVAITEHHIPNVHVQVDLVGQAERADDAGKTDPSLPRRPALATGRAKLLVPPRSHSLDVTAEPCENALAPGGETVLELEVRDANGEAAAGAEVAVVVVDEAVLALSGYRLADPLAAFYPERESGATDSNLRTFLLLGEPEDASPLQDRLLARCVGAGYFGAGAGGTTFGADLVLKDTAAAAAPPAVPLRSDLEPLALFVPDVRTDEAGRARVPVRLPDSLTRYRVMAVAACARQFGAAESAITARLPLMVRPSPPRFLQLGDRIELPVVVQNGTETPLDVDVVARAANASMTAETGCRIAVPPSDRVEVRFPVATARPGKARFQLGAASGELADRAELVVPVWTPATTEAFATYGELDPERPEAVVSQPVDVPSGIIEQSGGLEITTSSTALQALTDAALYLLEYPFECAEQIASRLLAVASLRDVLTAFRAAGLPGREEIARTAERDIDLLRGLQHADGGFRFWPGDGDSWPYVSLHAIQALQRAGEKGFVVPPGVLERSRRYVQEIARHIPGWYPREVRRTLKAYGFHVRNQLGDRQPGRARDLLRQAGLENLSVEAAGWLLPVFSGDANYLDEVQALRRHLHNRVAETAAAAHFAVAYEDGAHLLLRSDRRADAVVLDGLISAEPENDLIPKLVRGLLAHRRRGRWDNTQENALVLLALDRYFGAGEKIAPDFVARAWLGGRFVGEHAFRGRTTEQHRIKVPMKSLAALGPRQELILEKEGAGRLYYRIGLRSTPAGARILPLDRGFAVERRYEPLDDEADVRRDGDGSWRIRAGARVQCRLTLVARSRRYHVALVDPIPAGLEPLNPALAASGSVPQDPEQQSKEGPWWWWRRPWFEHQNLRDDRVEAFTSLLWEGVHTYTYVARATTPGEFTAPPPRAEEMYHPETFGRGSSDRVIVQ